MAKVRRRAWYTKDPRLPPSPLAILPKPKGHIRTKPLPGWRKHLNNMTLADWLMGQSKFGGTSLERLVDGAAAQLGIWFDAAQYYIPMELRGTYTKVDRVIFATQTLVFIDGPQHTMRPDRIQHDLLQKFELESQGWKVVHLSYIDLLRDPIMACRQILWGGIT